MTVLLTGAAGRIGTSLAAAARPWAGRCAGSTGSPRRRHRRRPDRSGRSRRRDGGVEAVVHLAGQPTEAPWPVIREANIEGAFQVFEAARRARRASGSCTPRPTTRSGSRPIARGLPRRHAAPAGHALRRQQGLRRGARRGTTSTGTACGSPACASARSPRARPTCGRCRPGCRPATAPGWSTPACARRPRATRSSGASRRTPAGRWSLDAGRALGYQPAGRCGDVRRRHAPSRRALPVRRVRRRRVHLAGLRHRRGRCARAMSEPDPCRRCTGLDRRRRRPGAAGRSCARCSTAGDDAELADRFSGPLDVRHRRAARPAARRPERDEPRRRAPGGGRAGRLAGRQGRAGRARRRRLRRPARVARVRARLGGDLRRGGLRRAAAAAAAADAGARVRRPAPAARGRGHGHGLAQPAAGQRLQGVRRRRRADRPAGRRRDRGRDPRGRPDAARSRWTSRGVTVLDE